MLKKIAEHRVVRLGGVAFCGQPIGPHKFLEVLPAPSEEEKTESS